MKNIFNVTKKILLLCIIGLWFSSCSDFLNLNPESSYSAGGFYKTQDDFTKAIAACYGAQQPLFDSYGSFFRLCFVRSDDTSSLDNKSRSYDGGVETFTDDDSNSALYSAWQELFLVISRCNLILDKIDGVSFTDATLKNSIKGEALALRAWSYFTLGESFGGMPLFSSEVTAAKAKSTARSTQAETFAFAEADFKAAIALLPESWSGSNLGRVTKYAAEGVLARLYMFQSNFASAKPLLADIIGSGKYAMATNYQDCFSDAYNNTAERVWEVQFNNGGVGEGQNFSGSCLPEGYSGTLEPFSGASAALTVSKDMVEAYETGDSRKDQSVVTNITASGVVRSEWYILKWLHYTKTPVNTEDWAINLPILRYTDVLMMYAECLNEAGYSFTTGENETTAFGIINKVRARAGLGEISQTTAPDQVSFRTVLQKERRVEFAFEGQRWYDLIRWGIAETTMNTFLNRSEEGAGMYKMATDGHQRIYAIPGSELKNYNDKTILWQNTGY